MDPNPYAPPKAPVADVGLPQTRLKRRRVIVMILFTVISLGIYYPVWFFRRRAALNNLDSPRKLPWWPSMLLAAFFVVDFAVALASGDTPPQQVIGEGPFMVLTLARLAVGLLTIWQSFVIKDILEDHLTPSNDEGSPVLSFERVQLSGLMTFFFQIYYLQHAINRHIADKQEK